MYKTTKSVYKVKLDIIKSDFLIFKSKLKNRAYGSFDCI